MTMVTIPRDNLHLTGLTVNCKVSHLVVQKTVDLKQRLRPVSGVSISYTTIAMLSLDIARLHVCYYVQDW